MNGIAMSDLLRAVEAEGDAARARLVQGPFLLEIPVLDPAGMLHRSDAMQASPTTRTKSFDADLLLSLKRLRGAKDTRVWPVAAGATIGRATTCGIQLSGEESVSKEHARFELRAGSWHIVDLGSTNGTFVDRTRIQGARPLTEMATLQTGGRRFAFVPGADMAALLAPTVPPGAIALERLRTELDSMGSRRFMLRHPSPYIVVTAGEDDEARAYPLLGGSLRIGRTREAEITIRHSSVSKWHGRLVSAGETWCLEDTGSTNGTQVNGRRLEKGTPVKLCPWDALTFGFASGSLYLAGRDLIEYLVDSKEK